MIHSRHVCIEISGMLGVKAIQTLCIHTDCINMYKAYSNINYLSGDKESGHNSGMCDRRAGQNSHEHLLTVVWVMFLGTL